MDLSGKHVVITGGSAGIGATMARAFSEQGARVLVAARSEDKLRTVAGAIPFPGLAAYSGTKAGITNFTETLRIEIKGTGVGLTVVSPGPTQTEMWDRLDSDERPFAAVGLKRFKRLGFLPKLTPEQIADATIDAVLQDKRFVRLPKRYNAYHLLSNAPRRLVEGALMGTKYPHDWEK